MLYKKTSLILYTLTLRIYTINLLEIMTDIPEAHSYSLILFGISKQWTICSLKKKNENNGLLKETKI